MNVNKKYHNLTLFEALVIKNTKLVAPITSMFDFNDLNNLVVEDDEFILPPIYRECIEDNDLDKILEDVRSQLPRYGLSEHTSIRTIAKEQQNHAIPSKDVIFGIDPLEQHGPHLNLATDYNISDSIINSITKDHPHFCKMPPIYMGAMRWAKALGASIDCNEDVLYSYVKKYVSNLYSLGVENITIVSTHLAPNHVAILDKIKNTHNKLDIKIISPLSFLDMTNIDCHAGEVETALSLYLNFPVKIMTKAQFESYGKTYSKSNIEGISSLPFKDFCEEIDAYKWNGIVGSLEFSDDREILDGLHQRGKHYFESMIKAIKVQLKNR